VEARWTQWLGRGTTLVLALTTACGRVGFEPAADAGSRFLAPRCLSYGATGLADNFREGLLESMSSSHLILPDTIPIDASQLAAVDLIEIRALSVVHNEAETDGLATWVANGGSAVVTAAYSDGDRALYNSLLTGLAVTIAGPSLDGPITQFSPHPVTQALTSLPFMGGEQVQSTSSNLGVVATLGATPVALAGTFGNGRVLVWGDDWVSYDSQWVTSLDVQRFWANAYAWLLHR